MQPLEEAIRDYFIPAITGQQHCSQDVRDLLALPCRLGGFNLTNPTHTSDVEFKSSCRITAPLAALIIQQEQCYNVAVEAVQKEKSATKFEKRASRKQALVEIEANCPASMKRCIELASEKGASNWLSVLPVEEHGFHLSKGDFRDALCMRYGWMLPNLPSKCACGSAFNVDHAMVCPKGGFPTLRHNEIRDITADLLTEVCHDVAIEPMLQPLTGEKFQKKTANMSDEARLDLSARGVWTKGDRAFFDERVFYPNARSNSQGSLRSAFNSHECGKKREYAHRVLEVEHASFTPLVFSSTGGMGSETSTFYKHLASLIANKTEKKYSSVMELLRCRISFSLIRSSVLCIRGSRSAKHRPLKCHDMDLINSEACLTK